MISHVTKRVYFPGKKKNAATHMSNSPKRLVSVNWNPPAGFMGDVVFRLVNHYYAYTYINCIKYSKSLVRISSYRPYIIKIRLYTF